MTGMVEWLWENGVVGDDERSQRAAFKKFIELTRSRDPVPPYIQRFVADTIERLLSGKNPKKLISLYTRSVGRPERDRKEFPVWAAWFAAYCDPKYSSMPMSKGCRFAEVSKLLGPSESTVKRRANFFETSRRGTDQLWVAWYGERYAKLRDWEWNEECGNAMFQMIEQAARNSLAQLFKEKRKPLKDNPEFYELVKQGQQKLLDEIFPEERRSKIRANYWG